MKLSLEPRAPDVSWVFFFFSVLLPYLLVSMLTARTFIVKKGKAGDRVASVCSPHTGFLSRGAAPLAQAQPCPELPMLPFSSPNLYPGAQCEMGGNPNACRPASHPAAEASAPPSGTTQNSPACQPGPVSAGPVSPGEGRGPSSASSPPANLSFLPFSSIPHLVEGGASRK